MSRKYVIGTGFFSPPDKEENKLRNEWLEKWLDNTWNTNLKPEHVYIINSDSDILDIDLLNESSLNTVINLQDNPGHVFSEGSLKYCGWSSTVLITAMLAYASKCDFIFKEQDCMCFGPWVERIYQEAEEQNAKFMVKDFKLDPNLGIENSLIFIKHEFIPTFIYEWMLIVENQLLDQLYPEKITKMIYENYKNESGLFTFGYGRDRPINYDDPVFYVQHIGYHKYPVAIETTKTLEEKGLI